MNQGLSFQSKVWLYSGMAAWHFITVPKDLSAQIKLESGPDQIRGMVKVEITVGKTSWKTSLFWDKKEAAYLLPLKADIRKKENILVGDTLSLTLKLSFP